MQGLFQSIENKVCLGRPRDPPSHDAASECVDDEGDIDNVLLGRDVRKITDPHRVWCWGPKHAVHLMRWTSRWRVGDRCFGHSSARGTPDANLFQSALYRTAQHAS